MKDACGIATLLSERFPEPHLQHLDKGTPQLAAMIGRRSIRRFQPEKVSKDLIDLLLAAALSAPSKSDYQQASVILIESPDLHSKVTKIVAGNSWLSDAPHLMMFCADTYRLRALSRSRGATHGNNDLEAFFNATVDAALVMQTFIIAAESIGLGCCPVSAVRNHLGEIAPLLALPPGVVPIAGLGFGVPADSGRISMRLPQRLTVHVDRYNRSNPADAIDDYDVRRQASLGGAADRPTKWSASKVDQLNASDGRGFSAFVKSSGFTL